MDTGMLKLTVDSALTSPWAMSAHAALTHKRADFTMERLDLGKLAHRSEDYAARSLTARVPMLQHGDFCLTESSAIAEYLDDILPDSPALLPAALRDRARARQLQAWLRSDLAAIRNERSTDVIFVAPSTKALSARAAGCARQLFDVADRLLPSGGAHLFGNWCIADLDLAVMLKRLVANGDEVPMRLVAYVDTQWSGAPVQRWLQARSF